MQFSAQDPASSTINHTRREFIDEPPPFLLSSRRSIAPLSWKIRLKPIAAPDITRPVSNNAITEREERLGWTVFGASFDSRVYYCTPASRTAERSFVRSTTNENKTAATRKIRCTRLLAATVEIIQVERYQRWTCERWFCAVAWNWFRRRLKHHVDFGQRGLLEPRQRIRVHFSIHKREIYIWVRHIAWIRGTALFSELTLFEFEAWSKRGDDFSKLSNIYIYIYIK